MKKMKVLINRPFILLSDLLGNSLSIQNTSLAGGSSETPRRRVYNLVRSKMVMVNNEICVEYKRKIYAGDKITLLDVEYYISTSK